MTGRTRDRVLAASALAALAAAAFVAVSSAQTPAPNPIQVASEQERLRELSLLKLTATRPGADNRDPASARYPNYDEAKANPVAMPDPLALPGGGRVKTAADWWAVRRPQILKAMDETLYGRMPAVTPKVAWTVTETRQTVQSGVPVVLKLLDGRLDNTGAPGVEVHIKAVMATPQAAVAAGRRTPLVMAINWITPPANFPPDPEPAYQKQILERGWSYLVFDPVSVQADNGAGLTAGVIGLVNHGRPRSLADWGVLRAWGWGASRALDYAARDPNIDPAKVAIFGHSRYGKAALVAMIDDPRFATGFISSSGAGGAAPYRRHWGEQIENVAAGNEYHWMAGAFLKYAADPLAPKDLPIDANAVIALVAPRPIFVGAGRSTADGDAWVDPHGMFMAAAGAGPVYKLLGKAPLDPVFPPPMTLSDSGAMAWRQHDGGHTPGPNWPTFLDFAQRVFGR